MTLKEWCIKNNRMCLLNEWDYDKNGDLTPDDISYGSNKEVYWLCKNNHSFLLSPKRKRCSRFGCPYCNGKKIKIDFNSFASKCKENNKEYLLEEWDYNLNNKLGITPYNVTYKSNKKVWWKCREHNHSYLSPICDKTREDNRRIKGCSVCNGKQVWKGFNDFETYCKNNNLKYLLNEWDYSKNILRPDEIMPFSNKKFHWICDKGHTYEMILNERTGNKKSNCPYCSSKKIWSGDNDFEAWCKQNNRIDLLNEWNYKRNNDLGVKPNNIAAYSNKSVW